MLQIKNLNAFYGQAHILRGISFELLAGELLVLQGLNGAGKTTLIKSLMGMVDKTADIFTLGGVDQRFAPTENIALAGMGYVADTRRIFTTLTVAENLHVAAKTSLRSTQTQGIQTQWNQARVLDLLPHLKDLLKRRGGEISGGEQRMLSVARALMGNPNVLLLDEPCEGVAPKVADAIAQAIHIVLGQGIGVILTESQADFAQHVLKDAAQAGRMTQVLTLKSGEVWFN